MAEKHRIDTDKLIKPFVDIFASTDPNEQEIIHQLRQALDCRKSKNWYEGQGISRIKELQVCQEASYIDRLDRLLIGFDM